MRFFNAGLEVAHDGSPVAGTVAPSSPPTLASSFAGRLGLLTTDHDNNKTDYSKSRIEATDSGNVGGLPSFSMGAVHGDNNRPPATPSEPSGGNLPWGTRNDQYSLER